MDRLHNAILASSLSASIFVPQIQILAQTSNFVDIQGYWAENYVTTLANRGIIGGFPDGSFKPNDYITRAQFAAIAVKAFDLPPSANSRNFTDVPSNYWASSVIRAISNSGLVTGFPDGTFRPEERITRTQALVILAKALGNKATSNSAQLGRYSDRQAVPDWAKESVSKAANARIIVSFPDPSLIKPNNLATRGEVAALIYQTLFRLGSRNLPALTIGLLDSTTTPTPPVVSTLVIEKIETNTTTNQILRPGDELLVTAYGTPKSTASFKLEGLNQNRSIAMTEVKKGVYKGQYTIRRNDRQIKSKLTVTLSNKGVNPVTKTFNREIAINTSTDGNNNNLQSLKPEITNLKNNDVIRLPVNLVGKTLPNANVQVTIEAQRSIPGVLDIFQPFFNTTVRANPQGKFNVNLPSSNLASGTRYRVRLKATLNNKSQSNELFLRQN